MEQNPHDSLIDLQVDQESKSYLRETTRWTNFIAIIYFIGFGFFLLLLLIVGGLFLSGGFNDLEFPQGEAPSQLAVGLGAVQGIIVFIYFIYGGIMLYRFAVRCRRAIEHQDQLSFTNSLRAIRNYFIAGAIIGIVGIIVNVVNTVTLF